MKSAVDKSSRNLLHDFSLLRYVTCMKDAWMFEESHTYELKHHLNATSKSQASNKQDSLSLSNLVNNSSIWNCYNYPRDWHLLSNITFDRSKKALHGSIALAGKHPEKTDHNVSIIHSSFILWHDWERKRQQLWQMQQWAHWMWSQKRT